MKPGERIIVALDVNSPATARSYAEELAPYVGPFKVGLELITAGLGPAIVQGIRAAGGQVFYDGKFMDIPNTVAAAAREATLLGSSMLNVHALSGQGAIKAAAQAATEAYEGGRIKQRPIVLGVTVLTSLNLEVLERLGIFRQDMSIESIVVRLALAAQESGLDGIIASPQEIQTIRQACGSNFLIVTPGVRPTGAAIGDQKRVMTPGEAIKAGADYLIIGRPILKPESGTRVEAAQRIAEEIASAL